MGHSVTETTASAEDILTHQLKQLSLDEQEQILLDLHGLPHSTIAATIVRQSILTNTTRHHMHFVNALASH